MRILVKKTDGTVAIIVPTKEATNETLIRDAQRVELYASHREVEDSDIPTDRYFRNAWEADDIENKIKVNMEKARPIHMNNLRLVRNEKLKKLDQDYIIADEQDNAQLKSQIAQAKQQLRDMPVNFDLRVYATPEELKEAIPAYLE